MPRRYYALLTFITLAAAFLRLWRLTEVPPGLHYDLAATALLGNEVAFQGYRPIFISAYTGHEALYYYWLALWFRLAGSSIFTLRLAAATLGVLAVPAAWFAVRELLGHLDEEASYPIAALATSFLAVAFFHVTFSRFGFRVIIEPVVQALALGFLFRGLKNLPPPDIRRPPSVVRHASFVSAFPGSRDPRFPGSRDSLQPSSFILRLSSVVRRLSSLRSYDGIVSVALAGLFTGLAAYTYLAARLFPVPLAIFWLALLLSAWRQGRLRPALKAFAVFTAAAVAAFAPLGLYFLRHPQDFLNRAGQVVPRPGEAGLLLQGLRRAAEMLFLDGEPYDRFNLPGLPLFGAVLGLFFVIGLLLFIRDLLIPATHTLTHSHTHTRLPYFHTSIPWLLLAWVPSMLLPTALAVHDIFPSNVRAFGLIPLLFVFPARGLVAAYRWLQKLWPGPLLPTAYPMTWLTLAALSLGTGATARLYFVNWANLPNQRLNNDADLTAIAAYLNETDPTNTSVYVSTIHYRHPTFAYLLEDFASVRWLTGGAALVLPTDRRAALYVFARSAPPDEAWLTGWSPHLVAAPLDPDGLPAFRAYRFEAGQSPPLPALTPLNENFANLATLTGYSAHTTRDAILLDLRWRIENPAPAGDFLPFARLVDAWDQPWTQNEGFSYPSEQWAPGDTLLTRVAVPLPAGLPPGDYTLKVGLYSTGTDTNLPRLAANGDYAGYRVALPPITLTGGPAAGPSALFAEHAIAPPVTVPDTLAGDLALLGFSANTTAPRQGEPVQLTLFWHAAQQPPPEATVTLRLGEVVVYAGQPVQGQFPFAAWVPGQLLVDRYPIRVPFDFTAGLAPLLVEVAGQGTATLGTFDIQSVDRRYAPPPVATIVDAKFGEVIALHGYSLAPGTTTTLSLAWQGLAPMDRGYTVFVHVLDVAGQLLAQADSEPQQGRYATSLWQPGEYVLDDYAFSLAPGAYTLRVGLYVPETGERLPVVGEDYFELTGVVVP